MINKNIQSEVIHFKAKDGFPLNLVHWNDPSKDKVKGPILLVHGTGVRAEIFNAPGQTTIIDLLIEEGYDVFGLNWRASIDTAFTDWDLDEAAVNDHPAAVQKVLELTGATEMKAIIHCQGSTSFMISAVTGLVPEVKAIISNAVSLHPIVPAWSKFKISVLLPLLKPFIQYLDAQWAIKTEGFWSKVINGYVQLVHRENDLPRNKLASFMYGAGFPAMWHLENLTPEVKNWIGDEFGKAPVSFYAHIGKGIKKGHLVSNGKIESLPESYADGQLKTDARFSFFNGEDNAVFLGDNQRKTFDYFDQIKPGFHSVHIVPGYKHLDLFFGKNAATDIFPTMIEELNKTELAPYGKADAKVEK